MIPPKATDEQHATYVANIMEAWHSATPRQKRQGRRWYSTAHQLADMMSEGNVSAGAGVIAALSANKAWDTNVRLAQAAFETGKPTKHVGDAIRKATLIMSGTDPREVLPMHSKTGMFYRAILDPTDPDAVVIDRHAHDIAVGEVYGDRSRGLSAKGRYSTLAHAYREAARQLGEIPSVVQAVTWVMWTQAIANTKTRGNRHAA